MKTVELERLQTEILQADREAIAVKHNDNIIGYFYPVNDPEEIAKAKDEYVKAIEQVMQETGWNEEQLVKAFTENQN